jgi:hypothetical protein
VGGQVKWVPRHDKNLGPVLPDRDNNQHAHGPWILRDINYRSGVLDDLVLDTDEESLSTQKTAASDEKFNWNSDGDDELDNKDMFKVGYPGYIDILGFHPYKEIVFFSQSMKIGLAYYLDTSRVQVLGNLYPTNYDDFVDSDDEKEILRSFPYTPCLI